MTSGFAHILAASSRSRWLACLLCLALVATISPSRAAEAPQRVFLLEGLTPVQTAAVETRQAFEQRLKERSSQPIEVFNDFLDLGRFSGEESDKRLVQALGAKFG